MMKAVVLVSLVAMCASQQYVWDYLKPALNVAEVQEILSKAEPGTTYPNYAAIPQTNFQCGSKKQPGFYADVDAQCQVFHRCDVNGNQTSYLCVNSTIFNQVTLVCDYFFNVDCQKFASLENFANERLYTDKPLFDTPPAEYVPPGVGAPQIVAKQPVARKSAGKTAPKVAKP